MSKIQYQKQNIKNTLLKIKHFKNIMSKIQHSKYDIVHKILKRKNKKYKEIKIILYELLDNTALPSN